MLQTDFYRGLAPADVPFYPFIEAAHCLHLPPATVRSWLAPKVRRRTHGPSTVAPLVVMADRREKRLSFNNLVVVLALSTIRQVHGLEMSLVRQGLDYLRELFATDRPLLHVQMQTDGQALFVDHDGALVDASSGGQTAMRVILDHYLERIERDAGGLPSRLFPFITRDQRERSSKAITIDPRVRFGRPCLAGTSLPTAIIASRHRAGDSIADLALDYDRPLCEIEQAIQYERRSAA